MRNKTICIDLDGTICHYVDWKGEDCFGEPISGVKNALGKLKEEGHTLIIFTTRGDQKLIAHFLNKNDIPFDYINENPNQPNNAQGGKLLADIYVDDRGLKFNGDWRKTLKDIANYKTWEDHKNEEKQEQVEYAKSFLTHDFEQCFQQMRHYDSQCWDIIKFCFGEVLLAITAIWALYCFSVNPQNASSLVAVHYNWLFIIILFISYVFVFISSYLVSRNRVYYVKTARYVNEFRKLALDNKPYGFKNAYNYYNNYNLPKVNERKSTQLVALYALFMLGMLCFAWLSGGIIFYFISLKLSYKIILSLGLFAVGYLPFHFGCIKYLSKENAKLGNGAKSDSK